jgi:4-cresol dehydrogenase (hydroxylating)
MTSAVPLATRLSRALAQARRLLGPERVLADGAALELIGRTTLRDAPKAIAVIRPARAAQVPKLLRIARRHRISLYPISRGRNWGWGEACPVTEGQVVLDLSDLARILEINAELGYAVIEPGVTQGQLARRLALDAPDWWLESTNAGPDTSIVGNVLERGLGMNDRTTSVCGLEVVLPDATVLHTGFGNFPRSRVTHVAKWGIGPSVEGLFSQSNLGVVTRMGIWLARRPRGAECSLVSVAESALPRLIDALRDLRLRNVLTTNTHIFRVRGLDRSCRWLAIGVIYGSAATRAAYRSEIQAAVGTFARLLYFKTAPRNSEAALKGLGVQIVPGIDSLFSAAASLCTGDPFSPSPKFILTYLGGSVVQQTNPNPSSADPLDNGYGLYFLWVTCPATGRDIKAAIELVTKTSQKFGFAPQLTVQLPNGRAAVLVVRICFDRKSRGDGLRASQCHGALLQATVDAGLPPWRLGIEGMSLLKQRAIDMSLAQKLKAWMDPAAMLAPGRYIWPVGPGRVQNPLSKSGRTVSKLGGLSMQTSVSTYRLV